MLRIELTGRIDENGQLQVVLPPGLPVGAVHITLRIVSDTDNTDDDDNAPWTQDELDDMLIFEPKTGAEIADSGLFGAWADMGITDSEEFIRSIRRREQERSNWSENEDANMVAIRIKGHIDENGHLQADLPPGLMSGEVDITVERAPQATPESETWTPEELANFVVSEPKTGAEIVASGVVGTWAHRTDITDSEEFIQELRRKERDRAKWSQDS